MEFFHLSRLFSSFIPVKGLPIYVPIRSFDLLDRFRMWLQRQTPSLYMYTPY